MSELIKITGIAVVGGVMALTLRTYNPVFAMLTALLTCAVIVVRLGGIMSGVVDEMKLLINAGGLDNSYIETVVKVIGIAYITQFGADMLRDGGESAIASKCELAGKLFILYLTMPVISDFLRICINAVEMTG